MNLSIARITDEEVYALIDFHEHMILDAEEDGSPGTKAEISCRHGRIKELNSLIAEYERRLKEQPQ